MPFQGAYPIDIAGGKQLVVAALCKKWLAVEAARVRPQPIPELTGLAIAQQRGRLVKGEDIAAVLLVWDGGAGGHGETRFSVSKLCVNLEARFVGLSSVTVLTLA